MFEIRMGEIERKGGNITLNALAVSNISGPQKPSPVAEGFDGGLEDGEHARTAFELFEQAPTLYDRQSFDCQ